MSETIKLKKGYDIKLVGEAAAFIGEKEAPATYALKPVEYGKFRPKLQVKVGDEVKAGSPLFYNKLNENAVYTSPVSGEVIEINRGPKRVIEELKILADKNIDAIDFGKADPENLEREEITKKMIDSGCWPLVRQRPFDSIPDPKTKPKAIFISAFNTSPLAPNADFAIEGEEDAFAMGLRVMKKLTDGKVHLNIHSERTRNKAFTDAEGVQINKFNGPHPAGNVGVQIHHVDPINKGETVWYANPSDIVIIGRLFRDGIYNPERVVALTGQSVETRKYHRLRIGANIENLIKGNVDEDEKLRYISGNVLTGTKIRKDGFLSYYHDHLTVIPEGDEPEFQGWLLPSYPRPSISRTFPWTFEPEMRFEVNTNMHGEERAYVVTGQYEEVLPMDIYPVYLIKAIMAENLDSMEGLGIFEVAPEDFALCEFVCTSKTPVQAIVRRGLELMEEEG